MLCVCVCECVRPCVETVLLCCREKTDRVMYACVSTGNVLLECHSPPTDVWVGGCDVYVEVCVCGRGKRGVGCAEIGA